MVHETRGSSAFVNGCFGFLRQSETLQTGSYLDHEPAIKGYLQRFIARGPSDQKDQGILSMFFGSQFEGLSLVPFPCPKVMDE